MGKWLKKHRIAIALGIGAVLLAFLYCWVDKEAGIDRASFRTYQPARDEVARPPSVPKNAHLPIYQPYCAAPETQNASEVCAQWGSIEAAQEANQISRINMWIAAVSLLLSILAVGGVWITYRQSQLAAQNAMELLTLERKPFLTITPIDAQNFVWRRIGNFGIETDKGKLLAPVLIQIRNGGRSGVILKGITRHWFMTKDENLSDTNKEIAKTKIRPFDIPVGSDGVTLATASEKEAREFIPAPGQVLTFHGIVHFEDADGKAYVASFAYRFTPGRLGGRGLIAAPLPGAWYQRPATAEELLALRNSFLLAEQGPVVGAEAPAPDD